MIYINNYKCTDLKFLVVMVCDILIYNISFPFSFKNITVVCRNLCFKLMF